MWWLVAGAPRDFARSGGGLRAPHAGFACTMRRALALDPRTARALSALVAASSAGVPGLAWGGSADAELALDVFTARTRSTEAKSGPEEVLGQTELGVTARSEVEVSERFGVDVDYRGREPLGGNVPNTAIRLLYEGHLRFGVVPDRLDVRAGRFLAPSVVFLPVDGVAVDVDVGRAEITAFGGRRGVTSSRANVPFDQVLPAMGLSAGFAGDGWRADLLGSWAKDVAVTNAGSVDNETVYGAGNVMARASGGGHAVRAGGQVAFAEQAAYVLGPTWADVELTVEAMDLWSGLAWVAWRPRDDVRVDASGHVQGVGVYRAGTVDADGDLTTDASDPRFGDVRLAGAYAPLDRGWLRVEQRLRRRPDRTEWRTRLGVDADDLGVPGLYAKARLDLDFLAGEAAALSPPTDRLAWSASAGWERGGFDVEAGTSRVERAALPVSGRVADPSLPAEPRKSDDLSPFVLEAQDIAFVRGFWTGERLFAGVDVERNLHDAEIRALVQVGAIGAIGW